MSLVNICVGVAAVRNAWLAGTWQWLRPVPVVKGHRGLSAAISSAVFGQQSLVSVFSCLRLRTPQAVQ